MPQEDPIALNFFPLEVQDFEFTVYAKPSKQGDLKAEGLSQ
jgi:hypothetical protein